MSKRKAAATEDDDDEGPQLPDPIEADVMDTKCWLLRVPNELAERWHITQFKWGRYHEAKKRADKQPNNQSLQDEVQKKLLDAEKSSELGKISIDPNGERTVGKLSVPSRMEGGPPETYKMNLEVDNQRVGDKAPHLRILQETVEKDEDGRRCKLRVAAAVTDYWNIQESEGKWRGRNETICTSRASNVIDIFDDTKQDANMTFIRPLQQHEITQRNQALLDRRPQADQRAERRSKDIVIDELFGLFKEQELWTTKDLRERTNQPEQHLKECLQEVATLHERGSNRGKWEIKDEFKG
mmetsp:Transcript_13661/g.27307  ORF Transcript_13661/g.27307 Transcript_13661/m.27307 type:complete len:297 (+) Transcript_13661:259-1149(+)